MSPFHPNPDSGNLIYTVGTSTRSFDEFLTLLKEYEIRSAGDVRSFPSSRFPQFNKDILQKNLESRGIQYTYLGKELGGFRKGGYIAYMETDSFQRGLEMLEAMGRRMQSVFFCSERFPWKCHRRWISEKLLLKGWKVIHIIEKEKIWIPSKRVIDGF